MNAFCSIKKKTRYTTYDALQDLESINWTKYGKNYSSLMFYSNVHENALNRMNALQII